MIPNNILALKYKEQNKLLEKALGLIEQATSINDTIGDRSDMCVYNEKLKQLRQLAGSCGFDARAAMNHFEELWEM